MVAQALELSRKPHVVIATPGRLADHLRSSNTFSIKKIRFLVSQPGAPIPPFGDCVSRWPSVTKLGVGTVTSRGPTKGGLHQRRRAPQVAQL